MTATYKTSLTPILRACRYLTVLLVLTGACSGSAYEFPTRDGGCSYYECRQCVRAADYDFACRGHELLTQAWRCPYDLDLCKLNDYGTYCCFRDESVP